VSLLELQKNSAVYDNSRVRVRGELWNNGISISEPKTGHALVTIPLEFKDEFDVVRECRPFRDTEFAILVQSGKLQLAIEAMPWIFPLPVEPISDSQYKAVRKFWKRRGSKTVEVVVVGRFDYTKWGRLILHRDGSTSYTGGFGPQPQSPYRIVVESIVIQKKTK
jgi:hypothetical protein